MEEALGKGSEGPILVLKMATLVLKMATFGVCFAGYARGRGAWQGVGGANSGTKMATLVLKIATFGDYGTKNGNVWRVFCWLQSWKRRSGRGQKGPLPSGSSLPKVNHSGTETGNFWQLWY